MVTSTAQIFSSASCVQQLIISERLNQIYIAAHRWKEEILSFPMMYHTSKSVTCIKFKGSGYDRSSTCERKSALGINTVSPISIDKSTLRSDMLAGSRGSSSVLFAYSFLLQFGQIDNIYKVKQNSLYFFS